MGSFGLVRAAPLRRLLLGWQATYGDDTATMACGFDLDMALMERLLGARPVRWMTVTEARQCCRALRAHPEEIWPQLSRGRLGPVDWETETFWIDAGVDPIVIVGPGPRAGAWLRTS